MAKIAINELNASFISEVRESEVNRVYGGSLLDDFVGVPNPATSIVYTPIGGTQANVTTALNNAIGYAGLNGFVSEVLHGGSYSFVATQPTFIPFEQLPAGA
ncbi:MAG: hypothetical protein ACFB4I_01870 [Cyanophyceae cyanobacterium]